MFNSELQQQEIQQQREQIEQFYRAKYPNSVGDSVKVEPEQKLTPEERQSQNQAFSDGLFKANQQANNNTMEKLEQVFKARRGAN